jgi:hypothetical protein
MAVEKALEFANVAWRNKLKIGSGIATASAASVGAANWVLANKDWLLRYFSDNPTMTSDNPTMTKVIVELVDFLKTLPLS